MPQIDPYTSIENFRELRRLELEAALARAQAVNQKNAEIVESGTALVAAGMDQWKLKTKVWETVEKHVSLLKLVGIDSTGRYELPRAARKGDFNVRSNGVRMQTGLNAILALEASGSLRARNFHEVADVDGLKTAIGQFVAPDVCRIFIYDQKTGGCIAGNCLDPGDFNSHDTDFSAQWSSSSNPFRNRRDFDCEAERGDYQPSFTLEEKPLTPRQLIYGAGLYAVHAAWLDEIQACLPS